MSSEGFFFAAAKKVRPTTRCSPSQLYIPPPAPRQTSSHLQSINMTDQARLTLRPQLNLAPVPTESVPEEAFQNDTLRPVAKLQNDLLVSALHMFLRKRKVDMRQTAVKQRFEKVKELVARDNRLRGLLFGIIVGQFTAEEMTYYMAHESEVNRRLTNLLTERLTEAVR